MNDMWKKVFKISLGVIVTVAFIYLIVGTFFTGGGSTNSNFDTFGSSVARSSASTSGSDEMEVALDKVLINMRKGKYSYMKADMSLKAASPRDKKALEEKMPHVRDMILRFSANQNGDELETNEGKEKYKSEMRNMLEDTLGIRVKDVYFRDFVLAR